jgi:tRNA modification GTPase
MLTGDTIAAISTPPGRGGIGVIRASGPNSLDFTNTIFQSDSGPLRAPNRVLVGRVIDPATGECIDEAVATYFKTPHSYTGEDVVELSCHGSPIILRRAIELLVMLGARVAEPGEFTFRAFFNRRIDLAQAQAIRDLINAQTSYQALVATRQLEGSLSKRLSPLKESLIEVIVQLESSLEFVEDDISPESSTALLARLDQIAEPLAEIASSFSLGRYLREGFDLAIVGRPNVGKSSVFNRLVGSDRAIVTELPGTTRDALYETTSISGVPVRLIDTAGIRETTDVVERIGVTRSRAAIAEADIVLVVIDQSQPLIDGDLRLVDSINSTRRIIALNKSDLPNAMGAAALNTLSTASDRTLHVSALTGYGFKELNEAILDRLAGDAVRERDDIILTDARQHAAVENARRQLCVARQLIHTDESEEIVLLKLHSALESLGEITGETLTEDILDRIFSTFCIGK